ncbi:MAG: transporter [Thermoguttaceae bacterium]
MSTTRVPWPALILAAVFCAPGRTQAESAGGTFFAMPGRWDTAQAQAIEEPDGTVEPASWDDSSWLLERNPPAPVPEQRPGFMARLAGLAQGRTMIEGGYAYLTDSEAGTRTEEHVVPDLLLRVGLSDRLEVRVGWPGVSVVSQSGAPGDSVAATTLDPNVGLMLDLCPQRGWVPQTALLGSVPITLGGDRFAMNSLQPVCEVLYQWQLGDAWAVGGSSGLGMYRDEGDHYVQWQQSVDVDYLLTDRAGLFSQWQALADDGSARDATRHMLSVGASWLWTDRLQITWRIGAGLNHFAPDLLTDIRFGFLY